MKNETYEEFVEKFKPKLTTDDCMTPPQVEEKNIRRWAPVVRFCGCREKSCRENG